MRERVFAGMLPQELCVGPSEMAPKAASGYVLLLVTTCLKKLFQWMEDVLTERGC